MFALLFRHLILPSCYNPPQFLLAIVADNATQLGLGKSVNNLEAHICHSTGSQVKAVRTHWMYANRNGAVFNYEQNKALGTVGFGDSRSCRWTTPQSIHASCSLGYSTAIALQYTDIRSTNMLENELTSCALELAVGSMRMSRGPSLRKLKPRSAVSICMQPHAGISGCYQHTPRSI